MNRIAVINRIGGINRISDLFKYEIKPLFRLAWPVMLSRVGMLSLVIVDTIMVGRYATQELAYLGIGQVPSAICLLLIIGLLMGTLVMVSKHYGAGRDDECGTVWWHSLPFAVGIGLLGLFICWQGEYLLLALGQAPSIAAPAGRVSFILGLTLPFVALQMTTGFFLEGIHKPVPVLLATFIANILNIFFNALFIYGSFGMPQMGAEGSAWATLIVRIIQVFILIIYVWFMAAHKRFGVRKHSLLDLLINWRANWQASREQRRIGYAAGVSMGIENTAFNALMLFAGLISAYAIASYTIMLNVFILFLMFGFGIATATAVRVGNAFGAGALSSMLRSSWVGLGVQMVFMLVSGLLLFTYGTALASFFTKEADVIFMAQALLRYASIALIMSAGQLLMSQILRARGENWVITGLQFVSFALVMVPIAWVAIFVLDRGVFGLVDGLLVGTSLAFILGLWRFIYLARRDAVLGLQA